MVAEIFSGIAAFVGALGGGGVATEIYRRRYKPEDDALEQNKQLRKELSSATSVFAAAQVDELHLANQLQILRNTKPIDNYTASMQAIHSEAGKKMLADVNAQNADLLARRKECEQRFTEASVRVAKALWDLYLIETDESIREMLDTIRAIPNPARYNELHNWIASKKSSFGAYQSKIGGRFAPTVFNGSASQKPAALQIAPSTNKALPAADQDSQ